MSSQTVDHGEGHVLDRDWLISWALHRLINLWLLRRSSGSANAVRNPKGCLKLR